MSVTRDGNIRIFKRRKNNLSFLVHVKNSCRAISLLNSVKEKKFTFGLKLMGCIFLTGKAFQKIRRREIGNWGCHRSAQTVSQKVADHPSPTHLHPQYPLPLGMLWGHRGKWL